MPSTCAAKRRRHGRAALRDAALVASCTAMPPLLGRLRADLIGRGDLRTSTATSMWSTYAAYTALVIDALAQPPPCPPLPGPVRAGAWVLAGAGAGLMVAGMNRFSGFAQISGTTSGQIVASGAYRYSRNPQYLGVVTALTGLALVRRSPRALALSIALAGVYRWWVPTEEEHLAARFGEPYRRYLHRTPRWIGRTRPRGQAG